ncbi:MAG TPA: pilus assembly protein PilP [Vicinamibacterales bacterium]
MNRRHALAIVLALVPAAAGAQSPAPQAPAPQAAAPATPAVPIEPQGFDYDPEGRRDPFVSLIRRGTDSPRSTPAATRPPGLGGLETSEVTLRGTLQTRDEYVAILAGADNRTYIVRVGDRLLDGTIRSISATAVVVLQQVNDPLSLEKQREVRKTIRQADEAK